MTQGLIEVRIKMQEYPPSLPMDAILGAFGEKPGVLAATHEGNGVIRLDVDAAKLSEFTNWAESVIRERMPN